MYVVCLVLLFSLLNYWTCYLKKTKCCSWTWLHFFNCQTFYFVLHKPLLVKVRCRGTIYYLIPVITLFILKVVELKRGPVTGYCLHHVFSWDGPMFWNQNSLILHNAVACSHNVSDGELVCQCYHVNCVELFYTLRTVR